MNFDPEGYESHGAEIPAEPRAESERPQPDLNLPETSSLDGAPPTRPFGAGYSLGWRDLAYIAAFYLIVGVALSKLAIDIASAVLHVTPAALQDLTAPYVAVVAISQAVLSAAVLGFLWLLVRSRGGAPFWPTVGWRNFSPSLPRGATAVRYLLGGAALAVLIQSASYFVGSKSSVPMEELFRDRASVLMMTALGVLVAPLVEETLFRGCIYPVIARSFGVPAGILLTGMLFGLAHSPQLAGAWKQVALVTVVGIVLTYIRARTGTVLASFLVHLGYNSLLFGAFFLVTGGLQHFPGS